MSPRWSHFKRWLFHETKCLKAQIWMCSQGSGSMMTVPLKVQALGALEAPHWYMTLNISAASFLRGSPNTPTLAFGARRMGLGYLTMLFNVRGEPHCSSVPVPYSGFTQHCNGIRAWECTCRECDEILADAIPFVPICCVPITPPWGRLLPLYPRSHNAKRPPIRTRRVTLMSTSVD